MIIQSDPSRTTVVYFALYHCRRTRYSYDLVFESGYFFGGKRLGFARKQKERGWHAFAVLARERENRFFLLPGRITKCFVSQRVRKESHVLLFLRTKRTDSRLLGVYSWNLSSSDTQVLCLRHFRSYFLYLLLFIFSFSLLFLVSHFFSFLLLFLPSFFLI